MRKILDYIKHYYIQGQSKCPECGEWCDTKGPVIFTGLDEYKCKKCNKYFLA